MNVTVPSRRTRPSPGDRRGGGPRARRDERARGCTRFSTEKYHDYKINKPEYKAANGHWEVVDVPEEYRHQHDPRRPAAHRQGAADRRLGQRRRRTSTRRSSTPCCGTRSRTRFKKIPTPEDLFCTGHTQLPDGKLLVAGGTKRYEKLKGDVTKAGGLMIVHNENPDKPMTLKAGTKFTGKENGKTFVSKDTVLVEKADEDLRQGRPGKFTAQRAGPRPRLRRGREARQEVRDRHRGQLPDRRA